MGTRNSKLAPCGDSYLLDVSGGAEPLSGFWSFRLTDDHDLFAAAGSVLKIHCLQFGNKSLRTLGRTAEGEIIRHYVFNACVKNTDRKLPLVKNQRLPGFRDPKHIKFETYYVTNLETEKPR